jgi:hypothetical protein
VNGRHLLDTGSAFRVSASMFAASAASRGGNLVQPPGAVVLDDRLGFANQPPFVQIAAARHETMGGLVAHLVETGTTLESPALRDPRRGSPARCWVDTSWSNQRGVPFTSICIRYSYPRLADPGSILSDLQRLSPRPFGLEQPEATMRQ